MGATDIVIICVVSVAFVAALGVLIYRKVKHKGGCDCGCDCCPHSCNCHSKKPDKSDKS